MFTYALVVPLCVLHLPAWQIVLGFVTMHAVPGTIIALTFQVTHIADGNEFPTVGPDGRIPRSRAMHELLNNTDVAPQNHLLTALVGGINVHLTHHFFPEISSRYLCDLAPIVESVAREYDVPYRKQPTLTDALRSHYRVLRRLAQPPRETRAIATLSPATPRGRRAPLSVTFCEQA